MALPTDFLKSLPYFEGLSSEQREQVGRDLQEISYSKGEIIFLEGEPCRGLFVVKSGRVRIFKSSAEGREQVLLIAQPGDSFNDVPVFDGGPNPASAAALDSSVVYLFPKAMLISLIADCPTALAVVKLFAERLRHLTAKVEELAFQSIVSRLAKLLLTMMVAEKGVAAVPRLTQDEMAAMIGSVRDVVGRALRHIERSRAIKIERHRILVVSPEKLKEMI